MRPPNRTSPLTHARRGPRARAAAVAGALGWALASHDLWSQAPTPAGGTTPATNAAAAATIRQWGISLRDNVTGRVQLRFSSTEAVPAVSGKGALVPALWDVTGLRLESFRADETSDFVIESPSCRVNVTTRDAASPGVFTARRESDGMAIRGYGFQFDGTERRLSVTNSVAIELRTRLFQPKPASP